MAAASLALPPAPLLDPAVLAAAGRRVRAAGRAAGFAAGSLAFAGTLWLLLAGPGFLSGPVPPPRAGNTLATR